MTVSHLEQHLANLRATLEAAGVRGAVVSDLAEIGRGLQPFRDRPLKEFADFLVRAEQYRANGEVPLVPPKAGKSAAAKAPAADAAAIGADLRQVYDSAGSGGVPREEFEKVMSRISGLKKADLHEVAKAIDLKVPASRKVDDIKADIRQRVESRAGVFTRSGL